MGHYSKHGVSTRTTVSAIRIKNMDAILRRKALLHKLKKAVAMKGSFYMTMPEMTKLFGKPLFGRDLQYVENKADELGFTVFYDSGQNEFGIIADNDSSTDNKYGHMVNPDQ